LNLARVLTRDGRCVIVSNMKQGRNDQCLCGSGKKFKKCCLGKPKPMSKELEEDLALGQQRIAEDDAERKARMNFQKIVLGGLVASI
jgi:SEC-C motif